MFDQGSGPPIVVVPGVQGRWEWMAPGLEALREHCRVISYSLCGDRGSGMALDGSLGFENYLRQLDDVYDRAGLTHAALCGVSYGGFIALRYAATRPERVRSLLLVSAPAPGWAPSPRQEWYLKHPRLSWPIFVVASPMRIWPEIVSAVPAWPRRVKFAVVHGVRVLLAPMVPSLAAGRVAAQQSEDFAADAESVRAPTLVITGEDGLDRVVPPAVSRRYVSMIPGARYEKLDGTGHIGMLTQPQRFADIVSRFVHAHDH
jgi:3-oxoadipate enol-lactonase